MARATATARSKRVGQRRGQLGGERVGRFSDAHGLNVAHDKNGPEVVGKLVDGTLDASADLLVCDSTLGIAGVGHLG